jgi:hypothetical protein
VDDDNLLTEDFFHEGQKLIGQSKLGILLPGSTEDVCFCGMFGVSAQVTDNAYKMMGTNNFLPMDPSITHFCGH